MLSWALTFFIITVICSVFGFTDAAVSVAPLAQTLFVVFFVLFLIALVSGLLRRP